jgi:hypothetical protein
MSLLSGTLYLRCAAPYYRLVELLYALLTCRHFRHKKLLLFKLPADEIISGVIHF